MVCLFVEGGVEFFERIRFVVFCLSLQFLLRKVQLSCISFIFAFPPFEPTLLRPGSDGF